MKVWVLWVSFEDVANERRLQGVYSSPEKADSALKRIIARSDWMREDYFMIEEMTVA